MTRPTGSMETTPTVLQLLAAIGACAEQLRQEHSADTVRRSFALLHNVNPELFTWLANRLRDAAATVETDDGHDRTYGAAPD